MNLSQAYSILNLPQTATDAEVKKRFRELSKQWHPDVNKSPDAEAKFKEINEANSRIKSGEPDQPSFSQGFPTNSPFNMNDMFNTFFHKKVRKSFPIIQLSTNISFKESILGIKKDFKFNKKSHCTICQGNGSLKDNNCKDCKGSGFKMHQNANMIYTSTCPTCQNKGNSKKCSNCNDGVIDSESTITVTIPPGVTTNNVLRLSRIGNFNPNEMENDDVFIKISVDKDHLTLLNNDVINKINISLLDALQGKTLEVNTVLGNMNINIPPKSKNLDQVIIPNAGVAKKGNQINILTVDYPNDVNNIIELLKCQS